MKSYVRLVGDLVAENISVAADADIATMFHPSVSLIAVAAPVTIGWVYDAASGQFVAPVPIVPSTDQLKQYAAYRRYNVETGGVVISGIKVATDRESQSMLNAAYNIAQGNPQFQTMWKNSDGTFTALNAATVIALAQAVGAFVAACFAAEAAAVSRILTGAITTADEIDTAIAVPA